MRPIVAALTAMVSLSGCAGGNDAAAVRSPLEATRMQPSPAPVGLPQMALSQAPEPPRIGRCHMGHCSWFRVLSRETIRRAGEERLVRLAMEIGISGPRESNDSRGGADEAPITWDPGSYDAYFMCSAGHPTVALRKEDGSWEATTLDFVDGPYGVTEAISAEYVAACHPGDDMARPGFAERHGYRALDQNDRIPTRPIARPEAMLDTRD